MTRQLASALRRSIAPALLVLAAALPAGAQQDTTDRRPTVVVWDFTNSALGRQNAELAPLGKGVADMLITELAGNPRIRVVERAQIQRILEEQRLSTGGAIDQATIVRVGRLLGAHHAITGVFVTDPRGTSLRMDARAIDMETSRIEHVETLRGKTDDVLDLVSSLAQKLNSGMKLPDMPRRAAMPAGSGSSGAGSASPAADSGRRVARAAVPFQAVMLYSRGLAEQDKGNRAEAVRLYRASLERFPTFDRPRQALQRLEGPAGGE